jgi:small subunit ribosomal protein S16
MLMIRLQRVGRRNHAEFRVVLTEHTRGPKSSYILSLGHYNPHTNKVTIDGEAVKEWVGKGAQVSDTVHNLLVSEGVIEGKKKNVLPKKTPILKEKEEVSEPAPETKVEKVAEESSAKDDAAPAEKEAEAEKTTA